MTTGMALAFLAAGRALALAFAAIVAISGITEFGAAGYPNVAKLFDCNPLAWVLSPASTDPFLAPPIQTITTVPWFSRATCGPQFPCPVR